MALLRPSLTLVLDLDERDAREETVQEIERTYLHICAPLVRTHEAPADAPVCNTARMMVKMGANRYLDSADEQADENWDEIVAPWIGRMLHKVGNNMKVFNDRQREIDLPEVVFERIDVELQGGDLTVSLHTDPLSAVDVDQCDQVVLARTLRNEGVLADAVRIEAPTDASYEEQRAAAWSAWVAEHPEALEPKPKPEEAAAPEPEKTYEQEMEEDRIAKSYENTAVPPTDSEVLPNIHEGEEEEEEPELFDFDVDYSLWSVTFADGSVRTFDSATRRFADEG